MTSFFRKSIKNVFNFTEESKDKLENNTENEVNTRDSEASSNESLDDVINDIASKKPKGENQDNNIPSEEEEIDSQDDVSDLEQIASDEPDEVADSVDTQSDDNEMEQDTSETMTDDQKVSEMFNDTGKISDDWSALNENNIRLFNFYFKFAEIDIDGIMNEDEKINGVPYDVLRTRLTTEQNNVFLQRVNELRNKFPLIAKREKNVILYNMKIPMYYKDEDDIYQKLQEDNIELYKDAIEKINKHLTKKFGEHWQDNFDAIDYLKDIKVDFSKETAIRPNLNRAEYFEEDTLPFNQIYVDVPESVSMFIRENIGNNLFNTSPIFKGISSQIGSNGATGIFPTVKVSNSDSLNDTNNEESDSNEESIESDLSGIGGMGGGSGNSGGIGSSMDDIGDDIGGDGEDIVDQENIDGVEGNTSDEISDSTVDGDSTSDENQDINDDSQNDKKDV